MPLEELQVGEDLTYQEYPVKILDTQKKTPEIIDTECIKCNRAIIPKKKLLKKKKINLRQSFQKSFPISSNLEGEIHPKGVGL
jgi:hypothetical protein